MSIWELQIDPERNILIVTPRTDLRGFDYELIEAEAEEVLRRLDSHSIKNVVLDFAQTDSFTSDVLAMYLKLWKQIGQRNGRVVFCNLSANQMEILRVTRLDQLLLISPCRETALRSLEDEVVNEVVS